MHGRGFAVVASEINKLANDTGEAVSKIQTTVDGVQEAFQTLINSSNELLAFLKDTVTPDYDSFVAVGRQYGEDAALFRNQADQVAEMVENIRSAMSRSLYNFLSFMPICLNSKGLSDIFPAQVKCCPESYATISLL